MNNRYGYCFINIKCIYKWIIMTLLYDYYKQMSRIILITLLISNFMLSNVKFTQLLI